MSPSMVTITIPEWFCWLAIAMMGVDTIFTIASVVLRSILLKRGLESK